MIADAPTLLDVTRRQINHSLGRPLDTVVPARWLAQLVLLVRGGAVNSPTWINTLRQLLIEQGDEQRLQDELERIHADPAHIPFPVTFVVDWQHLCRDNRRLGPRFGVQSDQATLVELATGKQKRAPGLGTTQRYRKAKALAHQQLQNQYPYPVDASAEFIVESRVFWPQVADPSHIPDVSAFVKMAHDALEAVVYASDAQIRRAIQEKMGCDPARPRLELTIQRWR